MIAPPDRQLKDRFAEIRFRIQTAAEKSGRSAQSVRLLAATKTVSPDVILEATGYGLSDIGENRVQEAEGKRSALEGAALVHHFIGQLQTNKARRAVELFDVIQSIDRLRLAEAVSRCAGDIGKRQRCLVEVKISDDGAKSGVDPADADAFIAAVAALPNLAVCGVMAIAPFDKPAAETGAAFRRAAEVFSRNRSVFGDEAILSMGMTDDFELAIAQGSTMVRVGRALFGERTPRHAG